jgi:hypothetical protein
MHVIETNDPVLHYEDGMLLGNGDLTVSVYQRSDQIVWRFGKCDVYDRRLDISDSPAPAHFDEIRSGIAEEGWVSNSYESDANSGKGNRKVKDPKRMNELCQGAPCYAARPYPCPKPVGELYVRIPPDLYGLKVNQRLVVEDGTLVITCTWNDGPTIKFHCFVPPKTNVLVVKWEVLDWNPETTTEGLGGPIFFGLHRWQDPPIDRYCTEQRLVNGYFYFRDSIRAGKSTPLDAPEIKNHAGVDYIEQGFAPDLEFPEGFRYGMVPFTTNDFVAEVVPTYGVGDKLIQFFQPEKGQQRSGVLAVAIPATSDEGGLEGELERIATFIGNDLAAAADTWHAESRAAAAEYWSRSAIKCDDQVMEDSWYGVLHAVRVAFRGDKRAPGLAIPSALSDYGLWHNDYHMNYNYQQPFWGRFTANQIDAGDSFYPGMQFMVETGRILAKKFFNARGTYIHLVGFPFTLEDDPYPTGSICRMTYMNGWVAGEYWRRYRYTLDDTWLKDVGYPVIRDCALFYLDTLEKYDDGKWHAFPSTQGESFFTGNPEDYLDRPQVIAHTRYCLQAAIEASDILGVDEDIRAQWQDIVDNLALEAGVDYEAMGYTEKDIARIQKSFPEFLIGGGHLPKLEKEAGKMPVAGDPVDVLEIGSGGWVGGATSLPRPLMRHLRTRTFIPDRDWRNFRRVLKHWQVPGGFHRGINAGQMGRIGAYCEALGVIAPMQEMMLQSWAGYIELWPAWPSKVGCRFTTLRAEDAFLVTSTITDQHEITELVIQSEMGARCRVLTPWEAGFTVTDADGNAVTTSDEGDGVFAFDTVEGGTYTLTSK